MPAGLLLLRLPQRRELPAHPGAHPEARRPARSGPPGLLRLSQLISIDDLRLTIVDFVKCREHLLFIRQSSIVNRQLKKPQPTFILGSQAGGNELDSSALRKPCESPITIRFGCR